MYIVLDQVMPIMLDEKEHYLILKECISFEDAECWIQSNKIEKDTYKIIALSSSGRTPASDSGNCGSNPRRAANMGP